MTRLEEIQNEVAKAVYRDTWDKLFDVNQLEIWHIIYKRYATECCKATLEKAARKAMPLLKDGPYSNNNINKSSITDESNIVIL